MLEFTLRLSFDKPVLHLNETVKALTNHFSCSLYEFQAPKKELIRTTDQIRPTLFGEFHFLHIGIGGLG